MFRWTEESIGWFKDAVKYNPDFYKTICLEMDPYLTGDTTVCDIGCGLGYMAMALSSKVKHITGVDIDLNVLKHAKREIDENNINNITLINEDWHCFKPEKKLDVVMMSYFSGILNDLEDLKKITEKYIISVLPYGSYKESMEAKVRKGKQELHSKRETVEKAVEFLEQNSIPYSLITKELEFGQPFQELGTAKMFISHYYEEYDEGRLQQFIEKNMMKKADHYYLPKLKKTGIIIIDLTKEN